MISLCLQTRYTFETFSPWMICCWNSDQKYLLMKLYFLERQRFHLNILMKTWKPVKWPVFNVLLLFVSCLFVLLLLSLPPCPSRWKGNLYLSLLCFIRSVLYDLFKIYLMKMYIRTCRWKVNYRCHLIRSFAHNCYHACCVDSFPKCHMGRVQTNVAFIWHK